MTYYDLGKFGRKITTSSPEAQTWFDRGLTWVYAFNHEESVKCFQKALEHDPDCAMAHWGVAYAAGPNYNVPWELMDPNGQAKALATSFDATKKAVACASKATPVEQALISTLPARFPQREPIEDMTPWNKAYTQAMRAIFRKHPTDLDVRCVFVDAIMNETPWQMWNLVTGQPTEGADTLEAMAVLDEALETDAASWDHPGLLHLYVHLIEMSPFPQKALRAGDRLRELVPDSGHLVHMPTHIDVLCGNYRDVVHWNQKAVVADRKFVARDGAMNFYSLYRIHNYHFVIYGAMFLGQYTPAMEAAQELIDTTPEALIKIPSPPMADFLEPFFSMKQHVLIRFGKWREIIAQELPEDRELYCSTTAMMLYAKGVAHSVLGEIAEAEKAREAFRAARARVPESRLVHNNTVVDLLAIAEQMLTGELEYRRGDFDLAFAHLRRAVQLSDALPYDEPWGWMQPPRHALGALLLEQGHLEEAEAVYRSDLGYDGKLARAYQHPENVWSLHGLHECLVRRGDEIEAPLIKARLDLAQARTEVPIRASCLCRRQAA
ncbi:MAG: tetratricopeptide repeat protein [Reyranella sp.]|nr:tetratricopeptide repeat protein [Reyranella sp.]